MKHVTKHYKRTIIQYTIFLYIKMFILKYTRNLTHTYVCFSAFITLSWSLALSFRSSCISSAKKLSDVVVAKNWDGLSRKAGILWSQGSAIVILEINCDLRSEQKNLCSWQWRYIDLIMYTNIKIKSAFFQVNYSPIR